METTKNANVEPVDMKLESWCSAFPMSTARRPSTRISAGGSTTTPLATSYTSTRSIKAATSPRGRNLSSSLPNSGPPSNHYGRHTDQQIST